MILFSHLTKLNTNYIIVYNIYIYLRIYTSKKKIDRYLKKHKLDLNTSRLGLSVKVRRHVWQRKGSIFQFCWEEKNTLKTSQLNVAQRWKTVSHSKSIWRMSRKTLRDFLWVQNLLRMTFSAFKVRTGSDAYLRPCRISTELFLGKY